MGGATEETRRELAADEAILRQSALVTNAVLRRALAIAARERVGADATPDAGLGFLITWVMQASDEIEREMRCAK